MLLAAVLWTGCNKYYQPSQANAENLRVKTSATTDGSPHALEDIISPYRATLSERMNTVIGQAEERLFKKKPESNLGNWVADAVHNQALQLSKSPVDLSIQNYGGIRIPEVTAGDITVGKIYELMPFDNILVIVEMDGIMTQRFFDHMAADGGWPISKEAKYILAEDGALNVLINGQPIQTDQTYRISMPDYIANGGGNCDFLEDLPRENTGRLVRDALIDEVVQRTEAGETISAQLDGRVRWDN